MPPLSGQTVATGGLAPPLRSSRFPLLLLTLSFLAATGILPTLPERQHANQGVSKKTLKDLEAEDG